MKVKFQFLLKEATKDTGPIGQFECHGFIFVAEILKKESSFFKENEEYDLDVKFYCHHIFGVYKNEEEFYKEHENINPESFIPVGGFPSDPKDMSWEPTPINWINSTVREVIDNDSIGAPDYLIFFEGSLLGLELDQVLCDKENKYRPTFAVNDIVSGIYWAEVSVEE